MLKIFIWSLLTALISAPSYASTKTVSCSSIIESGFVYIDCKHLFRSIKKYSFKDESDYDLIKIYKLSSLTLDESIHKPRGFNKITILEKKHFFLLKKKVILSITFLNGELDLKEEKITVLNFLNVLITLLLIFFFTAVKIEIIPKSTFRYIFSLLLSIGFIIFTIAEL